MCMFSSVLCGWLLNPCMTIWVCLSPTLASTSVCTHVDRARASPPLPYRGLRLARTGGPIKLTLWVLGLLVRSRGKGLFYCCVNHCFISTLLSPALCSDISQGFWPPFKCEHNTAIEIMAHTSCTKSGSALALTLIATTLCSITRLNYVFCSFYPQFFVLTQDAAQTDSPQPCAPSLISSASAFTHSLALEGPNVQVMDPASAPPLRGPYIQLLIKIAHPFSRERGKR